MLFGPPLALLAAVLQKPSSNAESFRVREPSLDEDQNISVLSPILNTCFSINLKKHNSLFVQTREVRYIILV